MNLHQFMINVSDQLKDKTVGWAVAVYQGSDLKYTNSGGSAVLSPPTKMTSLSRMSVMSMSKTISAAAIVALLPWKGVTIDSPIAPYLPGSWHRGPNVDKLTFRMLMTHTTGFQQVSDGPDPDPAAFSNLEKMIANGVPGTVPKMSSYLNANYSLIRIILPYLWHGPTHMEYIATHYPESFTNFIDNQYIELCKNWVLAHPSLKEVSVVPTGPQPFTRLYNFQNTSQSRASGGANDAMHAGHDHWYISAREYGRVIADLRIGTYVGGTQCWNTMTQSRAPNAGALPSYPKGDPRLGIWRFAGGNGEYFGHNGEYNDAVLNVVGSFAGWMAFPSDVTGVFLANSNRFIKEQEQLLMDAFDAS